MLSCAARMQSPETVSNHLQLFLSHQKLPHFETRDDKRNSACFPTCPFVSHGRAVVCVISTLKSWSVSSCRVSFCPATTYGVFPRGVVPLLRHVMPVKPQHGRYCQGASTPDDVMWWHTVTRHVPVANYISSIQKSIGAIRF